MSWSNDREMNYGLCSRLFVTTERTNLVSSALRQAIEFRRPEGTKLLHHSDRGYQYTNETYQHTLKTLGIQCSMSRTGCCYDNAVMERFFWSLNTSGPATRRSRTSPRPASACPVTSKPFTIHSVSTRRSTTSHPTNSKPKTPRLLRRNYLPAGVRKSWAIAVRFGHAPADIAGACVESGPG
jgi:transposase InsO family protein